MGKKYIKKTYFCQSYDKNWPSPVPVSITEGAVIVDPPEGVLCGPEGVDRGRGELVLKEPGIKLVALRICFQYDWHWTGHEGDKKILGIPYNS